MALVNPPTNVPTAPTMVQHGMLLDKKFAIWLVHHIF